MHVRGCQRPTCAGGSSPFAHACTHLHHRCACVPLCYTFPCSSLSFPWYRESYVNYSRSPTKLLINSFQNPLNLTANARINDTLISNCKHAQANTQNSTRCERPYRAHNLNEETQSTSLDLSSPFSTRTRFHTKDGLLSKTISLSPVFSVAAPRRQISLLWGKKK